MTLYNGFREILKVQKLRRIVSYTGFYCFTSVVTYAYTNNTTRAGYSRADQYYASYPAGTELLTDAAKLYKQALGYCFEMEDWGPIEWCVMADHFDRQGKAPYEYHAVEMNPAWQQGKLIMGVLQGQRNHGVYLLSMWGTKSVWNLRFSRKLQSPKKICSSGGLETGL